MEMKAIIYSLINYPNSIVYSDSSYAVNTFNSWMYTWQKNGWINSSKKTPKNINLVQAQYDLVCQGYKIDLRLIKGHAGHKYNELADLLATGKITTEEVIKKYGK